MACGEDRVETRCRIVARARPLEPKIGTSKSDSRSQCYCAYCSKAPFEGRPCSGWRIRRVAQACAASDSSMP